MRSIIICVRTARKRRAERSLGKSSVPRSLSRETAPSIWEMGGIFEAFLESGFVMRRLSAMQKRRTVMRVSFLRAMIGSARAALSSLKALPYVRHASGERRPFWWPATLPKAARAVALVV